ncbi:uncharacterized protein KY384_002222 [Bacidia gigantensis]|uniref:uncharacterized protein n=1 Tax=Bacidia gigantensis TaxID=2732470 RepID=UPI001D04BF18|nr:uncharacterized protein KY384_002222 [Bacidia gigantensis]KAG8533439.1 hypothetical protein KY384_002222 [Bacidia gigantensis]
MPTTYTINFNNNSNSDSTYAFFVKSPELSPTPGSYFSNVWISQFVPNGATFDISTTDQFYAWTGTSPETIAPGVKVKGGDGKPANLATVSENGSDYPMTTESGAAFFKADLEDGKKAGSFAIQTDGSFQNGQNYLVGLGQLDLNNDQIVPVATAPAQPGFGYTFTPVVKYYVAETVEALGTVVEIDAGNLEPGTIDFTNGPGQGRTTANVTVDHFNHFAVTYQ